MVTGLPVAVEALAAAPHDVHPQERARHGIEAGGQHENVQVRVALLRRDARRRDSLDAAAPQVDLSITIKVPDQLIKLN